MGKRKLNGTSFYQCEWTGFPMKIAHCYMPTWSANGKLVKKGSYCNWEAVVAQATHQLEKMQLTPEEHMKILEHVEFVTGATVQPAPHYDQLLHTKGRMDAASFHQACVLHAGPITAVKITPGGDVFEVVIHPQFDGGYLFDTFLHRPYNHLLALSMFHSMRKKGAAKGTERDLSVWYYATKELPPNTTASNLFKMQLFGDILLVQQSREASFMPRERYISFNKALYEEQFFKKKRRGPSEPASMTPSAYDDLKQEMQATLNSYEQRVSADAAPPRETSKAMSVAPTDGRMLASKIRERQAVAAH
tara:strand:+ start:1236 stop:2150 length:915 start_codon:yes stop_codon:yes gene_type:complete